MKRKLPVTVGVLAFVGVAGAAFAQDDGDDGDEDLFGLSDIEVPSIVIDDSEGTTDEGTSDIDLANVVQSAARGVTTVQEAPAIVTVITSEEIEERHLNTYLDIIDTVPGYLGVGLLHNQFPNGAVRGQIQASLLLHDGVSMFDPYVNTAAVNEVQPIELIKRVEVITGPGGVLWGANSLLGIMNVITKDAEDVDGVEVGVRGGDGNGNRRYLHGYVMAGKTELFSDDSKLLVHGSFKTRKGIGMEMAQHLFSAPLPQPNSPVLYGPMTQADPAQSFQFNLFAKLTMGKTQLRVMLPYQERHLPAGFPGIIVRENLPEDSRPECQQDPETLIVPGDGCSDKGRASRDNYFNSLDRYAVLEYKTRLASGKAGVTAKIYLTQFVREFNQIAVLSPIEGLLEGGLAFHFNGNSYRGGAAIDGDVELPADARLLYGVEAFHERAPITTGGSRQGEGTGAAFIAPYQLERLPLPCPRRRAMDENGMPTGEIEFVPTCPLTFAFPSSRTVMGAYLAPQWRPNKKLILDAGARVQLAPDQLGVNSFAPTPTFAVSAVYNLVPNWHLKLNGSQGFRPPVFNNLNSNGEAVQIDGEIDLETETTNSAQAEINARIFKGDRRIRELNFRLDYSYTQVENLIQVTAGRYRNTGDRGINSVEFLGKLYVEGGHRLELGYTFLKVNTADKGALVAMPEHWFNMLGVFNLVDDKLRASTNLRVLGAHEDANRLIEHRILSYDDMGNVVNELDATSPYVKSLPSELVLDRIPPSAELMVGVTWTPTEKLEVSAEVFNAFNGRSYQPDLFFDYEPRLEFLPNPAPDLRAFLGATYSY